MTVAAYITGMGAVSPIGLNIEEMAGSLKHGNTGFNVVEEFSTEDLKVRYACQVLAFKPEQHFPREKVSQLDRTAQLAIVAAREAISDAGIHRDDLSSYHTGLVMGVCAGGKGDATHIKSKPGSAPASVAFYNSAHHLQTAAVAEDLGVRGPTLTLSTACASGTSAIAAGLTLIRSGQCDLVICGGSDGFSRGTFAAFYSLDAMSPRPTSPFSVDMGITVGEGAGFVILESGERMRGRQRPGYARLLAFGSSCDAYHITAPHPTGEGLSRAVKSALADAGISASDLDYINAHGTGTKDNDISETIVFGGLYPVKSDCPPVSSSKSFFGHTMGAAGALEFITGLLGQRDGFLPPTMNFKQPRPGCDLDYVPNVSRPGQINCFLSTGAAFGGVNAAVVACSADWWGADAGSVCDANREVTISGLSVVSPLAFDVTSFHQHLMAPDTCVVVADGRFQDRQLAWDQAALMPVFNARKLTPRLNTRRMSTLAKYACVAAQLAMDDAGITGRYRPERIGVLVVMCRGPLQATQAFNEALEQNGISGLGAKYFPPMAVSTISGEIGKACQIKGDCHTLVGGWGSGLQGLAMGNEFLRQSPNLDALVVVTADEISDQYFQALGELGLLAPRGSSTASGLYAEASRGVFLAEGAAAVVLEKERSLVSRGGRSYGRVAGYGMTSCEGMFSAETDRHQGSHEAMEAAINHCFINANLSAGDIGVAYDHPVGLVELDSVGMEVIQKCLGRNLAPITNLAGALGLAESSSGLYSTISALKSMQTGAIPPLRGAEKTRLPEAAVTAPLTAREHHHSLLVCSNECGQNISLIVSKSP
ncbi:MAG: hypothetical protein CML06_14370 [Pseudomonadales bacterium]|nr:hypothetical protein [Pseudomonadales bacterium]